MSKTPPPQQQQQQAPSQPPPQPQQQQQQPPQQPQSGQQPQQPQPQQPGKEPGQQPQGKKWKQFNKQNAAAAAAAQAKGDATAAAGAAGPTGGAATATAGTMSKKAAKRQQAAEHFAATGEHLHQHPHQQHQQQHFHQHQHHPKNEDMHPYQRYYQHIDADNGYQFIHVKGILVPIRFFHANQGFNKIMRQCCEKARVDMSLGKYEDENSKKYLTTAISNNIRSDSCEIFYSKNVFDSKWCDGHFGCSSNVQRLLSCKYLHLNIAPDVKVLVEGKEFDYGELEENDGARSLIVLTLCHDLDLEVNGKRCTARPGHCSEGLRCKMIHMLEGSGGGGGGAATAAGVGVQGGSQRPPSFDETMATMTAATKGGDNKRRVNGTNRLFRLPHFFCVQVNGHSVPVKHICFNNALAKALLERDPSTPTTSASVGGAGASVLAATSGGALPNGIAASGTSAAGALRWCPDGHIFGDDALMSCPYAHYRPRFFSSSSTESKNNVVIERQFLHMGDLEDNAGLQRCLVDTRLSSVRRGNWCPLGDACDNVAQCRDLHYRKQFPDYALLNLDDASDERCFSNRVADEGYVDVGVTKEDYLWHIALRRADANAAKAASSGKGESAQGKGGAADFGDNKQLSDSGKQQTAPGGKIFSKGTAAVHPEFIDPSIQHMGKVKAGGSASAAAASSSIGGGGTSLATRTGNTFEIPKMRSELEAAAASAGGVGGGNEGTNVGQFFNKPQKKRGSNFIDHFDPTINYHRTPAVPYAQDEDLYQKIHGLGYVDVEREWWHKDFLIDNVGLKQLRRKAGFGGRWCRYGCESNNAKLYKCTFVHEKVKIPLPHSALTQPQQQQQ